MLVLGASSPSIRGGWGGGGINKLYGCGLLVMVPFSNSSVLDNIRYGEICFLMTNF